MALTTAPIGESSCADDLRRLADRIDSGELMSTTGTVMLWHRPTGTVGRYMIGHTMAYVDNVGLLQYAVMMAYDMCKQECEG